MKYTLPIDSNVRKDIPVRGGCYAYFPAALVGVARWSKKSNDKHNPGEPLHHARGKSMDHEECIERHSMDLADVLAALDRLGTHEGMIDTTYGKVRAELIQAALDEYDARAWRSLAASQEFREKHGLAPLAPGARLPAPAYNGYETLRIPKPDGGVLQAAEYKFSEGPCMLIPQPDGSVVAMPKNPPHVERAFQEWEANAAEKRTERVRQEQKRDDATEQVIEQRRVEAMQRRLIDTELAADRPLEVNDDWSDVPNGFGAHR